MQPSTVHEMACKLAHRLRARIKEHRESKVAAAEGESAFDVAKLMDVYMAIAMTDPNELISIRVGCCRHCHGVGFGYQWREREYLRALDDWERTRAPKGEDKPPAPDPAGGFGYLHSVEPNPDCPECGGEGVTRLVPRDTTTLSPGAKHLYRGAQQTKEGLKIIFADKDATLERIGRMLGAFDDKLRVDLNAKIAALKLTTSDPREAADAYSRMIKGS